MLKEKGALQRSDVKQILDAAQSHAQARGLAVTIAVVGAVGVTGAKSSEDAEVARAGIAALSL